MSSTQNHPGLLPVVRLFLLIVTVAISFGGFTFYAAVVVPAGGFVIDETSQGFVTQRVTHFLNCASGVTLGIFLWECVAGCTARTSREQQVFVVMIVVIAASLLSLVVLHPRLDALLQYRDFTVLDPEVFYRLHQYYLWSSTLQWLATLIVLWLTCVSFRCRMEIQTVEGCLPP